ncbi:MAG: hypothetical protein KDA69_07330, partial [Planctomycetaceae bacterium]|nr:hypothetical protein [Planctomycetaceae bacterium]
MSRIYQDYEFVVAEASNRPVLQLLGLVFDDDGDDAPGVVYMQFADTLEWHRFFVQAHIGFWETYDDATIQEEFDDANENGDRLVDYGPLVGGLPRGLTSACSYVGEFDAANIRLTFDNG